MKIFIKIFSLILFIIVFLSFFANFLLPFKKYSKIFLFPKTSINLGLNYYYQKEFLLASKIFNYFNKWQPTVEALLFEGYCLQKVENFVKAKEIFKNALNFNPKSREAHLALIEVNLKMIEKNGFNKNLIEEIVSTIPYEDKEAIEKISIRILKISQNLNSKDIIYLFQYFLSFSF